MRRAGRALAAGLGLAYRADRGRTIGVLTLSMVTSFTGVATAWSLKVIVDAAARGDESGAIAGAGAVAVVAGVGMLAAASVTRMLFPLREHTSLLLDRRLIDLVGGVPTVEHHERQDHLARVAVLRREGHVLASSGLAVAGGLHVLVEAVATGVLLAFVNPVLLAIPLFALPSLWAAGNAERLRQGAMEATATDARRARHLFELTTSPAPAKELRIYDLGAELLRRHDEHRRHADAHLDRAAVLGALWIAWGWLFFTVGYAGAVGLVVRGAVNGTASLGDVVLALVMVAQVNDQVSGAVSSVTDLARTVTVADRYLWLREYAAERSSTASEPVPAPDCLSTAIELRGVSFRYGDGGRDVLHDLDLRIPAGATVALVGENGAGKSTLVKLLCGLHRPTGGTVLVDGIDLERVDVDAWRSRVSAGFQDFARLELTVGHTVGVGDLPFLDDSRAVTAALDRAGSADVPEDLPDGLDTPLGASFEGGTELSGGQWQKLALARAMMRPAPLLLVLDEPTAALDADTEHALFTRYAEATETGRQQHGAVTLLVSHRFSTVRMADLIAVIDDGRVIESGSHADLVAKGGLYAELYELQARSYR